MPTGKCRRIVATHHPSAGMRYQTYRAGTIPHMVLVKAAAPLTTQSQKDKYDGTLDHPCSRHRCGHARAGHVDYSP
ncbi:hypothetical protein CBM2589_B100007 [Cupriavidus taiwanensis]|uniref:Uncharacterized protein n=1 Tax=Cupriavidus taiwanensis TaxID=164546 RepID=A0A375BFD8_9BURK|nr:hypothetical protein CBM2589_B100007 [Cupriavidus taiwanensis]